jgi:arylsulfatase A-like enzyme
MRTLIIVLLATLVCPAALGQGAPRPNILFLFADDHRPDAIGAAGNPHIQTPQIDALAGRGFRFGRNYCMGSIHGAVCQPSRAMLNTGRTLYRVKMDMAGAPTLGETLRQAGYQTFGTGKWHNGRESFLRSFERGRNIMFGGMSDHLRVPVEHIPGRRLSVDARHRSHRGGGHALRECVLDAQVHADARDTVDGAVPVSTRLGEPLGPLLGFGGKGHRTWMMSMGGRTAHLRDGRVQPELPYAPRVLRTADYKLWGDADGQPERLHHLPSDPDEQVNLIDRAERQARAALDLLTEAARQFPGTDGHPRYTALPAQPWDRKPAASRAPTAPAPSP